MLHDTENKTMLHDATDSITPPRPPSSLVSDLREFIFANKGKLSKINIPNIT